MGSKSAGRAMEEKRASAEEILEEVDRCRVRGQLSRALALLDEIEASPVGTDEDAQLNRVRARTMRARQKPLQSL